MDLQSWAAVAAVAGMLLAHLAVTSRKFDKSEAKWDRRFDRLDAKIDHVDASLGARIEALDTKFEDKLDALDSKFENKFDTFREEIRSELATGLGRIDTRLTNIEQRTFELSMRLPPAPSARQA